MNLLYFLAAVLSLSAVWFLVRPLARTAGDANQSEQWHQLNLLRDRLLVQLRELEQQAENGVLDEAVLADERNRLQAELAPVLKEIESMGDAAASGDAGAMSKPRQRLWLLGLGVFIVPLTTGFFVIHHWNTLQALYAEPVRAEAGMPPLVLKMVARLEARLRKNPRDAEGWARLGRSYAVLGRLQDAHNAYRTAYRQAPQNIDVVAAYAAFMYQRNPQETGGEVREIYQALRQLEPRHPGALWFFGLVAYTDGDYRKAIQTWKRLKTFLPPESRAQESVNKAIESATEKLKAPRPN